MRYFGGNTICFNINYFNYKTRYILHSFPKFFWISKIELEELCILAHPVILSRILACRYNLHQNFCLTNTFPEICNKKYLSVCNFKVATHLTPLEQLEGRQFMHLQIAFYKSLNSWFYFIYLFIYLFIRKFFFSS